MDLITYGLLNKAKANLDSPSFTGKPTAPTPLTPDNSNKLATTEFVRSVIATLKGFYLGVTTTTLVDEVTTNPNVVINGETVTAEDGNWVIASGGEEFVYSGTVWQKFGDSNWISVIGDTYKSNLTYNTHDCVIYMDGLYECQEDNITGDWDSTKWQSTTVIDLITGGIPLENLSNVDIINPQAGNHLVFDGTKWKNSTIVSPALSELSDVELENATDGQALVYNDTIDKWENQDIPTGQVTKTATGNPIELTDAASAPMVKCVTQITGSQDLHGQDKPWVGGAGKNKFNKNGNLTHGVYLKQDGTTGNSATWNITDYEPITPGTYTMSGITEVSAGYYGYCWYDSDKNYIGGGQQYTREPKTITIPSGASYIRYSVADSSLNTFQFESGSTATSYAPYSNICPITAYTEGEIEVSDGDGNTTTHTTTFPSAIFRGSEDVVNGEATSEWPMIDLGDLTWNYVSAYSIFYASVPGIYQPTTEAERRMGIISSAFPVSNSPKISDLMDDNSMLRYNGNIYIRSTDYTDATTFKTGVAGYELAYELATPTTSSVTPTNLPIRTLSGYNHIESSTGEMEIEYITQDYQPLVDLVEDSIVHLVPNPSGTATEILNKLGIDNAIYEIPKELPSVTSTDDNKVLTVVNGAWTKANPQTGMSESVIADEYNSTKTYNIADYCMHSGKLYKCNTANTTGAWDSAKWDETCVGDELTLKTAVIVAPRVDQTATYTYNGTEQTLAFEYINSNNTIVTGNKHTDAGTYTCTVSLKNPNDLWSDTMDNVDKTFTWTINKVTSSITLSPTTFYFSNGTPQTLTATVVGQPLVLSGYDTSLITITQISAVSGVYTYNIKATGTAGTTTITASIAESTNYTAASATASVETEAFTPGATLVPWSSGTDQEITDMINSYYNGEITLEDVKSVWSIGDVRNVDISAMTATGVGESHRAQTVEMEILDFDHDTLTTPVGSITKALITVDMKNCLRDANVTDTTGSSNTEHGYINSSNTNVGGWTSCARRTWCNNVFYNALPAYFKSLVKPVDKLTSAGNQSDIINTDSDYCFLLSEIEIFGSVSYSKAGEGSQYAWFANATANRYKLPKWNSSSVSDIWWERSPYGSNSYIFCYVNSGGGASIYNASGAFGLAPACCL